MDWVFKDKMQSILLGRQWLQSLMSKESFILKRSSVFSLGRKSSIFKHGLEAEEVLDVRMQ